MPDLSRRVVVLTFLCAVAASLLAPNSTESATPSVVNAPRLLSASDAPAATADRGAMGRARSASLSLALLPVPIGPEDLAAADSYAGPGTITMKATLYPRPSSAKVAPPPAGGTTVTGTATWYCCTLGWRGVAVVALPGALGGHYDAPPAGSFVTVCADRCVELPIVDYCGCLWGTADQRVADLSPEAWAAVTDRSQSMGVVTVTLHFGA